MDERIKDSLVAVGWAVVDSSIALQALLRGPVLTIVDFLLLFAASLLAGMVLVDSKEIILGFFGSIFLSFLIMLFCLTLPVTLGVVKHVLWEFMVATAIIMMFRGLFPTAIIVSFLGGLLGGIVGERLSFR
jgi:hypothetical protein